MLLYSFPALSETYTKNLKAYVLPLGIPLTQVSGLDMYVFEVDDLSINM